MIKIEQVERYKNLIVNTAIILAALIIAHNIYNANLVAGTALKTRIGEEEKKNLELEKIGGMEKKITAYKKLFPSKEAGAVMNDIVGIAKISKVEVLSVKPLQGEVRGDYVKNSFSVSVIASNYDDLAKFINALETSRSFYMIDGMDINRRDVQDGSKLVVNLRMSSVAAKVK
ncbi:MAG: hypothetical protein PHY88_03280 [Candidatus Omnitrophica bacterium]|nr:hypothetical protein [Candidatus Omnitrophota bacterium]